MKYVKILIAVFFVVMLFVILVGCSSMHNLTDIAGVTSYQQDADDKAEIDLVNGVRKQIDDRKAAEEKCHLKISAYTPTDMPINQINARRYNNLPEEMPKEYKDLNCDWYIKEHKL